MKQFRKRFRALWYADRWNIGYCNQTVEDLISQKRIGNISWLTEDPTADYSADPFVLAKDNNVYVYYEYLNFLQGKGKIYFIKNFQFANKKQVSGLPNSNVHLSYPYIFKDEGQHYCIPESADENEVALYRFNPGNYQKLCKQRVLISGNAFVDTSMIKFDNYYWLFTSIRKNPQQLLIYYAQTLLDEFKPHKLNPLITSNSNFRNAGAMFIYNKELYRPTQNLEVRYGGSIMINKILKLSQTEFIDQPLFEIMPQEPYVYGIHNISFTNDLIVIDGKKITFSYFTPFKKIVRKLKLSL